MEDVLSAGFGAGFVGGGMAGQWVDGMMDCGGLMGWWDFWVDGFGWVGLGGHWGSEGRKGRVYMHMGLGNSGVRSGGKGV